MAVLETARPPDFADEPEICHFVAQAQPTRSECGSINAPIRSLDLPILLYHEIVTDDNPDLDLYEVSVGQFQRQLDQLQRWGFTTLSLTQLVRVLDGKEKSPPRPVVITFDDAYRSFLELALPEVRRRGMAATVFVPASEIGGANRWDRERGFPERPVMTVTELRACMQRGAEIGAHGWLHRNLIQCSRAEAEEEILRSQDELAQLLGTRPVVFAYPYGDYLPEHYELLETPVTLRR